MNMPVRYTPLLLLFFLASAQLFADGKYFRQFGENKVFYSAFNSSFIEPKIANLYNISRGKDKGLVNIAVVSDSNAGKTAKVTGIVSNIFAQQKNLDFFEVREGDSVYYLAPFEFENEDSLTFKIDVTPGDSQATHNLKFQKTFYHDE